MRTKVLGLELSDKLSPLWVGDGYDSFWILVFYHKKPIGWVWISVPSSNVPIISAEQLLQEIVAQLGESLPNTIIGRGLSPKKENENDRLLEPISVVVCTHNHPKQLQRCLEALLSSDYPSYEIVVVNNAPNNDDSVEKVVQFPARYVHECQLGLSWARNRGIVETRHNIVAFIQDNAQVDSQWLYAINEAFAEPNVAAVTGLVAPAELETTAQFLYEFDYNGAGKNLQRQVITQETLSESDFIRRKYGMTANVAFRRNLFTQIGLFDTALDISMATSDASDMELLHRILNQGYTLIYDPCVLVWHVHQRHLSALHRQIFDKTRSLGYYLLSCWHNRSIKRALILQLLIKECFNNWILRNLVRPPRKLPRYIALIELAGMLSSPLAYFSRRNNVTDLSLTAKGMRIEEAEL